MVKMIPPYPMESDSASGETTIFKALEKGLAQSMSTYYVFHSFEINTTIGERYVHSEGDFIILNQDLGVLCIEAKNGQHISKANRVWYYSDGTAMPHDGPFKQSNRFMYNILHLFTESNDEQLQAFAHNCRFQNAVWFFGMNNKSIDDLGWVDSEDPRQIVLGAEALENPEKYIKNVFADTANNNRITTNLTANDIRMALHKVFCPAMNIVNSGDEEENIFYSLLREQKGILDFLDTQKDVVIHGPAGTGKTVVAIERAKRDVSKGEKVLYLCFNSRLREFLEKENADWAKGKVDFKTIDSYIMGLNKVSWDEFRNNKDKIYARIKDINEDDPIVDMWANHPEKFGYDHVIIDEGQDFGIPLYNDSEILEKLHDIVHEYNESHGTFYFFYDKMQTLYGNQTLPDFIQKIDCRVPLVKNCRNSKQIATTSAIPIKSLHPECYERAVDGDIPSFYFTQEKDISTLVEKIITQLGKENINPKHIEILSCKKNTELSDDKTSLRQYERQKQAGYYKFAGCDFTTCTIFKGLEADAVILVDVNYELFSNPKNVHTFYEGTSRAKRKLFIIVDLNDDNCEQLLTNESLSKTLEDKSVIDLDLDAQTIKQHPKESFVKIFGGQLASAE